MAAFDSELASGGNGMIDIAAEAVAKATPPQNVQALSENGMGYYCTPATMIHLSEGKLNAKRVEAKHTNVSQITIVVNVHLGD